MRIFVSAGEPSGDIHGANLIRELKKIDPTIEFVGFGGDNMEAAGCKLLFPLCQLAVMWFLRVLANAPTFLSLLSKADRYFRHKKPDAIILIDYPGFHWWLARRGNFHKIPVFYFVPPQLWGWASWRVKKMRRFVDHVLCTLPFEKAWYEERGVDAEYVGHPFFDELPEQKLDQNFIDAQRGKGKPIIALLPGSRNQEIERNLSALVRTAGEVHASRPDVRFLVACFRPHQQKTVNEYLASHPSLPIETHVYRTPEIVEVAHACVSVSGSVSLELLYRRKPTVIIYRVRKFDLKVARYFIRTPYITLVNLLAGKELFPEFLVDHCPSKNMAKHVLTWLNDAAAYKEACAELTELSERACEPGACGRAAEYIFEKLITGQGRVQRAA